MVHSVEATWENGKTSGYLRTSKGPQYFSCDLISHIRGNLYVGGYDPCYELASSFKTVVSLYPWGQYEIADSVVRHEFTMYDGPDGINPADLETAAQCVFEGIKVGNTLVHCQAGINRSNIVAGRTLMMLGFSAEEAIALLREKRSPFVLSNEVFERQLLSLGK